LAYTTCHQVCFASYAICQLFGHAMHRFHFEWRDEAWAPGRSPALWSHSLSCADLYRLSPMLQASLWQIRNPNSRCITAVSHPVPCPFAVLPMSCPPRYGPHRFAAAGRPTSCAALLQRAGRRT
jgi:hypothetical protein